MIETEIKLTFNLGPLHDIQTELEAGLRSSNADNPVRRGFRQIAEIYRSWTKLRWIKYSRGGGDWKGLSASTLAKRRKGTDRSLGRVKPRRGKKLAPGQRKRLRENATRSASILIDTATMIAAVDPGAGPDKGGLTQDIPYGIRVGIGGGPRHKGAALTIGQLAAIQHNGNKTIPARPIIVQPDPEVIDRAARILRQSVSQIIKQKTAG